MAAGRHAPEFDFATLQAEIAGYRRLAELLAKEQQALRRADADALPALVGDKQRLVGELHRYADARSRTLRRSGFEVTRAAAEAFVVATGAGADAVRAAWDELEAAILAAQRANLQNGRLIEAQRSYFGRALAALAGASGMPAGYGADGRPRFGPQSRVYAAI
jgi:flagellar biosynthesis/type III secretory pathway chaperone